MHMTLSWTTAFASFQQNFIIELVFHICSGKCTNGLTVCSQVDSKQSHTSLCPYVLLLSNKCPKNATFIKLKDLYMFLKC